MIVTFFHHMALRYKFWLGFHLFLGIAAMYSKYAVILWVYVFLLMALLEVIINGNRYGIVHLLLVYFLGFELLGRMLGCSPLIPWESGKYLSVPLLIFGILTSGKPKLYPGLLLVLFSLPAVIVYVLSGNFDYQDIVFNYFGLLGILLGIIYFQDLIIEKRDFILMARLITMPLISILTYVIIASPDIEQINFGNSAASSSTAGFGSNQVSTLLGIGYFIPLLLYILNYKLYPYHYLNLLIIALFLFRGLLTFSRGGVYVPTIATVLPFIIFKKNISIGQYFKYMIIGALILGGIFVYSNQLTNNALINRYSMETENQENLTREELINEYSTGRWAIFQKDLAIWIQHPLCGIGVGMSKYEHPGGAAAHIELSRLIAEHGLFGLLLAVFLFVILPIREIFERKHPNERICASAMFIVAILSTFHSATRTLVPVIFYGLAFLRVNENKPHPER